MILTIQRGEHEAVLSNGELTSYRAGGYEFIHQKESPGWGHSDIEMFPIIGPTAAASYRVQVPRGNAIQDQHGMLRDMEYRLHEQNAFGATFKKTYSPRDRVKNSKYPDRSPIQWLVWPYSFEFQKTVMLTEAGLRIQFRISAEKDMPFMLGYHPAFKLRGSQPYVQTETSRIALREVMAAGSSALLVEGARELSLHDEHRLTLKTEGFKHFMLWTEVVNMICIEPITFYPYSVEQHGLHQGFDFLSGEDHEFSLEICPETR